MSEAADKTRVLAAFAGFELVASAGIAGMNPLTCPGLVGMDLVAFSASLAAEIAGAAGMDRAEIA